MKKIMKGDMLYDEYLDILNEELEQELILLDPKLKTMKAKFNAFVEMCDNDKVIVDKELINSDSEIYAILLYHVYLFIAWLNQNI